jgi:hypothetical protein
MNRLGEEGLEHENGYLSATGNHRDSADGRAFKNDVQHHLVVPRILKVLMMNPINKGAVNFHVAVVRDAGYLEKSVMNVGSAI